MEAQLPYKTRRGLEAEMNRDGDVLDVVFHKLERDPANVHADATQARAQLEAALEALIEID